jgi:hypothetical protein
MVGTDEASTESLERHEEASPTRGERTRGNGVAGFDEVNTESPKRHAAEWAGAYGAAALLVGLLGILVYALFSST